MVLWAAMLFSGIHATLAGVVLAMTIPLGSLGEEEGGEEDAEGSPLCHLEDKLGPWVAFLVLPVFGFANAGVSLAGASMESLLAPLSLGIAAGLFLGKQIGIMISVFIASRTGLAQSPRGCLMARDLRCGVAVRHRLHHESFHRLAGVC